MFNYEDIAERFWNLPQKGLEEYNRERNFIDDIILKSHTERYILNNLAGVSTVFDGGAGAGRFSVLLAKKGISVTHFDISDSQINMAKEYAKREGVFEKMQFVKGRLGDLPYFLNPINKMQYILDKNSDDPLVNWYINHSNMKFDEYAIDMQRVSEAYKSGLMEKAENVNEKSLTIKEVLPGR